jgi:hypothetical protein
MPGCVATIHYVRSLLDGKPHNEYEYMLLGPMFPEGPRFDTFEAAKLAVEEAALAAGDTIASSV